MKMQSKSHGVVHWKLQRISAIAMIPLIIWFVSSLVFSLINGYDQSITWLQSPLNATGMVLLFGTLYFHAASGLQVVIEDYVHNEGLKIMSLILIKLVSSSFRCSINPLRFENLFIIRKLFYV